MALPAGTWVAGLRDGTIVLGKEYQGVIVPVTYANRTQAEAAAQRVGGEVIKRSGRPFYVAVPVHKDNV